MYANANGIRIQYRVDGREGAPWVTFVNGIANDATMWDGQLPALEDDFCILRYDARGHGGTEATEGDYTFDTLIGDLVELWDALEIEQSHLVGLGLGGSTAIGVGVEHPNRLLSLVPTACRADMTPDFATAWPVLVQTVKENGIESIVEQTVQRWFSDDFKAKNPGVLDSVRAQIRGTNPLGYYGVIAAFLTLNFADKIGEINVPTLFIGGADDQRGGPPDIMQGLADKVPDGRYVAIPNASHICNIQNTDGYNKALAGFLRGV